MNDYDFQAGIARQMEKETRARRILGVSGADGPEKIRKAFRLLMLNPGSTHAAAKRRRRRGVLGSARCWEPDAAVRLQRNGVPGAAHARIHREPHADFYIVRLTKGKGGTPPPGTRNGPRKPAEARYGCPGNS